MKTFQLETTCVESIFIILLVTLLIILNQQQPKLICRQFRLFEN